MKAIRRILLLGVMSGVALGTGPDLNAAEPTAKPAAAQPAPAALTGKVVAVDRAKKSITVDIKGRVFVFKLSPQLTVRLNDQEVPVTALSPGQTISLLARRSATGSFEIVGLNIQPGEDPVVAAGKANTRASARAQERAGPKKPGHSLPPHVYSLPTPFLTEPNPDNGDGGVVSPND